MVVPTDVRYAPWPRRAGAFVLDLLPVAVLFGLALGVLWLTRNRACDADTSALDLGAECANGISPLGSLAYGLVWLLAVGYLVWNAGWRQGRRGATVGKSAFGLYVVGAETGAPVGFWWALARTAGQLLNVVTLGLGFLWPLWDRRNQSFADKLAATVCVSGTR
ncbi:RDD family protein [Mycolicibacterium grossiae]|uniref:RDD domain-containing protein n=1 Tax=Mycolicibacterium grossiae TaxID=1552759 RepID=A0A1E8QAI3_9MYCO|nr:RDD family protein [Mycolicibacterium grossiae]OFJ55070.1 hypothetical protein BEL07_03695 [Mycolicibacterium grossiae]QEM47844.1 RDD family protein [Mycolicibacterium grossiae]